MSTFENLGQALRWLRNRQNRKQYQIAKAAGITKAMLSSYETGKQYPSMETLDKILGALHIDVAELDHALKLHEDPESRASLAAEGAPLAWPHQGGFVEPRVNPYRLLGIDHQLPAEQERHLQQTLLSFHGFLRSLYDEHRRHLPAAAQTPLGPRRLEEKGDADDAEDGEEDGGGGES